MRRGYGIEQQKENHVYSGASRRGHAQRHGMEVKVISDKKGEAGFCKQQYNEGRRPPSCKQGRLK